MTYLTEVPGDPGPDKEENVIVIVLTVQASEDIEKGEIVMFDATGVVPAAQSTTPVGPYYVALDAHTYATSVTTPATALGAAHQVRVGKVGTYDVQLHLGQVATKGQLCEIADSSGEVQPWDHTTDTQWWDPVGIFQETVTSTACYSVKVLMGSGP